MKRFFKVPNRLLYKKYFFLNVWVIKSIKIDKTYKALVGSMVLRLRIKYRYDLTKKNHLSIKKKFSSYGQNMKKLYKSKKLNLELIKIKMIRKTNRALSFKKIVRKLIQKKKIFLDTYIVRGTNSRGLSKRIMIRKSNRRYSNVSWIKVNVGDKNKKPWWIIRELKRKIAFHYGFIKIKKFRYINKINKKMNINHNYIVKLECMLNIFILRLNLFENIFQINNLIKKARFIEVEGKLCTYPYRVVNVFETVSISKFYFKKALNIFIKRSRYNKTYLLKKNVFVRGRKKMRVLKNTINIPSFIEYNYKIMHFTMLYRPKLSQMKGHGLGLDHSSLFDWAIDTKLKYHYK